MEAAPIDLVPVEVLRKILLLVNHLPGELGIAGFKWPDDSLLSGGLSFDSKGNLHTCSLQSLRIQLSQRRRLALVSRHWNSMMLEILYRTIRIRSISDIYSLRQLICGSKAIAGSVRRVYLAISASRFAENTKWEEDLAELISACPRLALFQDVSGRSFVSSWSQETRDVLKRSLQYLDASELVVGTSSRQIFLFASELSSFQALRVLVLPPLFMVSCSGLQPLSFPHLEILDIGQQVFLSAALVSWITGGRLPRLHTLRLSCTPEPIKALAGFWKILGHQIQTVIIDLASIGRLGPLDRILPNLQQLILYPPNSVLNQEGEYDGEYGGLHVKILEISGMGTNMPLVTNHVRQAMKIGATLPNLRILRFTQMSTSASSIQLSQIKSDIDRFGGGLGARGVQIENSIYLKDPRDYLGSMPVRND